MMDKINIEIDGKTVAVEPGAMVIEAADNNGIYIPRFCYHKKLSIAANCRMCLVDVEKAPKPLPACATPVTAGMIVRTRSKRALEAQRAVMEFLLINHPLDCPICDQGGECELQDLAMGYGKDISRYTEGKRTVKDKDIGPLIATEMTRCIQCTRCVRFGEEVAGVREMGGVNRGEHLEIGTYLDHSMSSEISGNIIDLCPVGALTSKPSRFKARAWELQQRSTIAAHDALGSHMNLHVRRDQVIRVVPKENESLNETWLSDRDRFSYTGLESSDRLKQPMIKREGRWEEVDWQMALEQTAAGLQHVVDHHGPSQLAALASPNATLEEFYLLQKIMRALGSENIDHRLRQTDFSYQDAMPLFPGLQAGEIADIENADRILIMGSDIHHEVPLFGQRVRKAQLAGAQVQVINPLAFDYHFAVTEQAVVSPAQMLKTLASIANALNITGVPQLAANKTATAMAQNLSQGQKIMIVLGAIAQQHPQATLIKHIAKLIADHCAGKVVILTEGSNTAGASLAGMLPHRGVAGQKIENPGLNATDFWQGLKGYVLFDVEPALDSAEPARAMAALNKADFVVAFSTFASADLLEIADVILPIAPFTETSGTRVNMAGLSQSFTAVNKPYAQVRPGWKVLRVLGNILELDGFDYEDSLQVQAEVQLALDQRVEPPIANVPKDLIFPDGPELARITTWPIYRIDPLTRRAMPLQGTVLNPAPAVYMNKELAQQLGVQAGQDFTVRQGQGSATLPVVVTSGVPTDCVYIPAGFPETAGLGASFGAIEIVRS